MIFWFLVVSKLDRLMPISTVSKIYEVLEPFAVTNFYDMFPGGAILDVAKYHLSQRGYVLEGTNCPSYGVLKVTLNNLRFLKENNNHRIAELLQVVDDGGNIIKIPWTAQESFDQMTQDIKGPGWHPDDKVLIFIGLGRGFNKGDLWRENRCYFLALGIFLQTT